MIANTYIGADPYANMNPHLPVTEKVLSIDNLTVSLGARKLVNDVNLSLNENEILAIIGPSGCGKTTFISVINRIIDHTLPGAVISGNITLKGESIFPCEQNISEVRKKIGMVFQRPNPFPFSIWDNMKLVLNASGKYDRDEYDDRIREALSAVGLWESMKKRINHNATRLSGGEQQRLCIARALISNPDVILFDEPCSALDPISSAVIEDLIMELKERCSIMVITHDLAQANRISDRCALFWQKEGEGKLIEVSNTHELMNSPKDNITQCYVTGKIVRELQ